MADLRALYAEYDALFQHSETIHISLHDGRDVRRLMFDTVRKNFEPSHIRAIIPESPRCTRRTPPHPVTTFGESS